MILPLLASYGLCFALMNDKVSWLTDRLAALPLFRDEHGRTFFERMFACPFCTGFHTGWLVGVGSLSEPMGSLSWCWALLLFAFASSAFCYAGDTVLRWVEG